MKTNIILVCKVSWKKSKPLQMASTAENSVTKMTNNSTVANPTIPLIDMTKAAALVRTTYPNREGSDDEKLAYSNALEDLDAKLHSQILFVDGKANGSRDVIVGAGFIPISDTRTKAVLCGPVETMKLNPKVGGSVQIIAEMPLGATGLFFVIFTNGIFALTLTAKMISFAADATGIIVVPKGKAVMTLPGFSAFANISIVAYATNAAGVSAPSKVFSTQILK